MIDSSDNGSESISAAQRSELLERISSSIELRRAARLRDFLRYVGTRAIEDEHAQISESEIGVHVFGRAENYDTSVDNIVRVNASELRKRIATYYETEGVHETILLEIPRRNYTPQFHRRSAGLGPDHSTSSKHSAEDDHSASEETSIISSLAMRVRTLAVFVLFLALAGTCIYFFHQYRLLHQQVYGWMAKPALYSFWSGILESPRQTDLVIADTSVSMVEDLLKTRISLSGYLNRDYEQQIQSSDLGQDLKNDLRAISSRGNVSLGDVRVAQKILSFEPFSKRPRLQSSREYQPSAVKGDNVILIGSSRSNPWTSLFEGRLNFVLDYDLDRHEMLVRNRHPGPGETSIYSIAADHRVSTGLSVIDYLPNSDHTANVLIIAGTSAEATEAAGDFLTSEESLGRFRDKLHVRTLPYFEILLKTTKLAGTPLAAEVIAYRTLSDPPVNAP